MSVSAQATLCVGWWWWWWWWWYSWALNENLIVPRNDEWEVMTIRCWEFERVYATLSRFTNVKTSSEYYTKTSHLSLSNYLCLRQQ